MNFSIPNGCKALLLCEGDRDAAFLKAMAAHVGVEQHMFVHALGGKQAFRPSKVEVVTVKDPNFESVRAFGGVLDADREGDAPAAQTLQQINNVMRCCFRPNAPPLAHGEVKPLESGEFPGLSGGAFVFPDGKNAGELEDLLLESARESHPEIMDCVDAFRACARSVADDEVKKEAKKAVQALAAGLPEYRFALMSPGQGAVQALFSGFQKECADLDVALRERFIDLDSSAFEKLRGFLRDLAAA